MKKEYNALHQRHTEVGAPRGPRLRPAWTPPRPGAGGGGRGRRAGGRSHSPGPSFSADDTDVRGAHREVQDAASGRQQPDREQPAGEEVGWQRGLRPSGPHPRSLWGREQGPPRRVVSGQSVWPEQECVPELPRVLEWG